MAWVVIGFVLSSSAYNKWKPTGWNIVASNFITLSQDKLDITFLLISPHKFKLFQIWNIISCSPLHLRSTSISHSLYDDDMIGVAFYKGVDHIKVSNSKRRLVDYFAKTLGVVIVAKALTRLCMGPSDPKTNSWHNRRQGNCAENFSSTWTKSHQHNQNYNQVFTLKTFQNKSFFNT